ncbi:MAG: hydrogenase expression/formation protein HypE [Planctomycetota bacterium]
MSDLGGGDGTILMAHGAGGRATAQLVRQRFLPALDNPFLRTLSDAAVLEPLPPGRPALTTDGFVVDPLVFPGGDLGYLSVCGTVNDLAVAGAHPLWLTWALILEEGVEHAVLQQIVDGAARAAREAGVQLVAGDTKVVPRGKGDKVFAVTSGLGVVPPGVDMDDLHVRPGDAVVASGSLGDHGAVIMACRHQLHSDLTSCCAPVDALAQAALRSGARVRSMHDPTRGGVATVCHEVAVRSGCRIELDESRLPIRPQTAAVAELLGLDPLYLACEGRVLLWVDRADVDHLVAALHATPHGEDACEIGSVCARRPDQAPLVLRTPGGGVRPLDLLSGLDLPRIC